MPSKVGPSLRTDCRGLTARVGVHFGPVVVSRLGPDTHQHIATTGESINVASRLLEVAAQRKAAVPFSTDLLDRAGVTVPPEFSEEHEVSIRGRSQPLRVRFWHPVPRPA